MELFCITKYELASIYGNVVARIQNRPSYCLAVFDIPEYEIINILRSSKTKALFIESWMSVSLTERMLDNIDLSDYVGIRISEPELRIIDTILSPYINLKPYRTIDDLYFNYNELEYNILDTGTVKRLNHILENEGLLLSIDKIKPTLSHLFASSIKETFARELNGEVDNFYLESISEFILYARNYYSKEQIENFINKKISEEVK